jgi:hypothetical protein
MAEKNLNADTYVAWYAHEAIRAYAYFFVGFLVPFSLGHPQILVGTVVNATLVLAAIQFGFKQNLPLLFAPSLGVLARGLIFGPFTPFLVIMLPFIWAGNAILVWIVAELYKNKKANYGITLGSAAVAKSGFLFSTAFVLVSLSILPPLFLATMGLDQLLTALAGGAVAFGIHKSGVLKSVSF